MKYIWFESQSATAANKLYKIRYRLIASSMTYSIEGLTELFATSIKEEDQPKLLVLPYIRGLSERIEWAVSPLNIKAMFQRLMKVKERPKKDEIIVDTSLCLYVC